MKRSGRSLGVNSANVTMPVAAFRQGLSETGYVEGQNVAQMPEAAGPFHDIKSARTRSQRQ